MSILNHSIPSNGQPLLPPKASAAQDACQHLSMAQSVQGAHTLKQSQSDSPKKNSLVIARRDPLQGESISTISDVGSKKERFQFAPVAQSYLCLLSDNEKLVRIDGYMGDADRYISPKPSIVLSVSVSSAVKLDARQIELIARKMQKLTGFRNLRLENIVDPSLIAGFTISYGDNESDVIDLSVRGQLAALAARVESSERRIASTAQSWRSP